MVQDLSIINNYLEAAGENLMFGGSPSAIPNLVPTGIEIRRNYLYKPLRWKQAIRISQGRSGPLKTSLS